MHGMLCCVCGDTLAYVCHCEPAVIVRLPSPTFCPPIHPSTQGCDQKRSSLLGTMITTGCDDHVVGVSKCDIHNVVAPPQSRLRKGSGWCFCDHCRLTD